MDPGSPPRDFTGQPGSERQTARRISMTGRCFLVASLRTTSSSLVPALPFTGALGAAHRALFGQCSRGSSMGRSFAGGARV